jgi:hypothetical protein
MMSRTDPKKLMAGSVRALPARKPWEPIALVEERKEKLLDYLPLFHGHGFPSCTVPEGIVALNANVAARITRTNAFTARFMGDTPCARELVASGARKYYQSNVKMQVLFAGMLPDLVCRSDAATAKNSL